MPAAATHALTRLAVGFLQGEVDDDSDSDDLPDLVNSNFEDAAAQ